MSAWGYGNFENDSAMDWVDDLAEYDNLDFIVSTLERTSDADLVIFGDGYVDTDNVDTAVAAAEVIAALKGEPGRMLPTRVNEWLEKHAFHIDDTILSIAIHVVTRIVQAEELCDVWAEPARYHLWRDGVEDLKLRLIRLNETSGTSPKHC